MQIVIDIPEEYYNQATEYGYLSVNDVELADMIKSGAVLPGIEEEKIEQIYDFISRTDMKDIERVICIRKDATNGEVVKATFPNATINDLNSFMYSVDLSGTERLVGTYPKDWWYDLYDK